MNSATFEIPWPPSVNHYYRHVGPRVLISREGRLYRERVSALLASYGVSTFSGAVSLDIQLYPPDARRRDVDNCLKSLMDAFTFGGLYNDDYQVQTLKIKRLEPMPPNGLVVVTISNSSRASNAKD